MTSNLSQWLVKFRSPERLITTTLKPAVSTLKINMYTMEEYYAGGEDQFKGEYKEAIEKGRARVRQVTVSRSGVTFLALPPLIVRL